VRLRAAVALIVCTALAAGAAVALDRWVAATVLPDLTPEVSITVLDRDGAVLRAYTAADGRWRLPVDVDDVDPGYLAQLIAFEDKRFQTHPGFDPLALMRAGWQALRAGRVVSGGSTLTMQVARLLEEGPTGELAAKLRQMRVALALERRLTKDKILTLYLTLAPFGGNIEGVRAASLSWFGKEPRRLTPSEAALLVALPQAPEARRPDRHPAAARAARDRALIRAAAAGVLAPDEAEAALREAVPHARRPFPALAPHLADRMVRAAPGVTVHATTLVGPLQARLEALLRRVVAETDASVSAALIVVDHRTGEVLAELGAPDFLDTRRQGFVDMTRAVRSPGSALKPLIYGLAFEAGMGHPETLIDDRPMRFGTYAPENLDGQYRGAMSLRAALQQSRNIPAVAVLDAVGPAQLLARLRRAGVTAQMPGGQAPGLAIALGGIGVSLHDLVTVFAAIGRGGQAVTLRDVPGSVAEGVRVLSERAAWQVADVLLGSPVPADVAPGRIAFKTGTSYGHRDAWAVGFDGEHVIGVWLGRPDGAAMPGVLGVDMAAPVLFEAFARLKPAPAPLPPPPAEVLTVANADLPPPMRRFRHRGAEIAEAGLRPEIAFPPDGARVEADPAFAGEVALKLRSGVPPFLWLIDGAPLGPPAPEREAAFRPAGTGYVSISVIDATGAAARARVFVQ
jgi:penicillin-binding protein 1C